MTGSYPDAQAWAAAFSVAQARRIVPLIGNYRCGTHLFKSSAAQFRDIAASGEVLSRDPRAAGSDGFDAFLSEVPDAAHLSLTDPDRGLRAYLAWFLSRQTVPKIVVDLKYTDIARLGMTPGPAPVPQVYEFLGRIHLPVIHLMRHSVLRETLSNMVAFSTGVYLEEADQTSMPDQTGLIYLEPETVLTAARRARRLHLDAAEMLDQLNIRYHRIYYEELDSPRRQEVITRTLHAIGHYAEPPAQLKDILIPQRSTEKVANLAEIDAYFRRHAPELAL